MFSGTPELERLPSDPAARTAQALERCIERLNAIIEAETSLLKGGGALDFAALNARKSHALMEFIQASKGARASDLAQFSHKAARLRELLASNAEMLERHLQATQEIAMLVIASIRSDESDGTYTIPRSGAR